MTRPALWYTCVRAPVRAGTCAGTCARAYVHIQTNSQTSNVRSIFNFFKFFLKEHKMDTTPPRARGNI